MTAPTKLNLDARPVIDLEHRHFEATVGNILVIGTWFMDPETKRSQPCLVLVDATKPLKQGRVIPCIITLDQAWMWTVEIGDEKHVGRVIRGWLAEGALPGNPHSGRSVWAVFDAVQSRLRDMMMMPPMPAAPATKYGTPPETVGDLVITDQRTGAVLHEVELTKHVRH